MNPLTRIRDASRALLAPPPEDLRPVEAAPAVAVRELLRRFWPDARPYKRWIGLGLVLACIVPVVELAEIWLFKLIVDDVLVPRDLGPLAWIALAAVVLTLVGGALGLADEYLAAWVGERFVLSLRTRVFAHLQRLPLGALDRRRSGDLVTRLTGDIQAIEALVLAGIAEVLSAVVRILLFGGVLFILAWQLALAALVVTPLSWLAARKFSSLSKAAAREKRRRSGSLGAVAEESLANQVLVQAYNRQDAELERFTHQSRGVLEAELAATRIRGVFEPVVNLLELIAIMSVVGIGTYLVTQGELTIGGLLVFMAYVGRLYSPIRALSSLSTTIFAAAAGAERVTEMLEEKPRIVDRPGAVALVAPAGRVELEAVTYAYPGTARPALAGVTLHAAPGERVALVGPSGAGKSTVARLLLRFDDPDEGAVRLDGRDARELTVASLREAVTLLPQETLLFHGTVRENIAFARPDADDAALEAAARAAGAHEFVRALPQGYQTLVGERGRALSGGQRQRIAIARALLRDAPVLLLDEPTTGLDGESTRALLDPLRRLMEGRTTIVISHDLLTVHDADRIVVLDGGRVVAEGGHDELLAEEGLYARLFRERRPEAAPT